MRLIQLKFVILIRQVASEGLSMAALSYLPTSVLTASLDDDCSICLENMLLNQKVAF
jgi:hypothetical protein